MVIPALVLFIAVLLYAGCSEVGRYRTLSFFFDGVPPPEGMESEEGQQVTGPWGIKLDPDDPLARKPRAEEEVSTGPVIVSVHAPYRDGRCFECHRPESGYESPVGDTGACQKCHASHVPMEASDWVHGPVAARDCFFCHEAHQSEYEALLTGAEPELCLRCHDKDEVFRATYHVDREQRCTTCHDAHRAGNRLLLADSRTYEKRKHAPAAASPHASWAKETCASCHDVEHSNVLVENVDQ